MEKKRMIRNGALVAAPLIAVGAIIQFTLADSSGENNVSADENETETVEWDKTFPENENVEHQKVTFENRYGIELTADMYLPSNVEDLENMEAIIVGHPFGGVKEQTSGLYAQEMADRGFVTIAFDASFNGESGGEPRNIASPEAFVEDFSAAVDFLGTQEFIDRDRIGVIGVCASGGFSISAASADPRLKAVATVSMYDMGRAHREGLGYAPIPDEFMTEEERQLALEESAEQRWIEFDGGEVSYDLVGEAVPLKPSQEAAAEEFSEYYGTERGQHPRSLPMTLTSRGALMNFTPFSQIETISPRPMLFIAGEEAHSRYYSEEAYELASEPKTLEIVPNAGHVDLYDQVDLIPFDTLESFFSENL
ncbi:alpha/beta hydrolase [Shouchella hunanensis]|uniref:Alpha/beta hydrolase n=1 Tax=Shouchella hunanensis TaxID=766894 RepID=A0ABY7W9E0_9BACI|nr:alpha/beta hydrolase [Shouchella hunanensis]WDF05542.1 alpha/beta hydrolase [Shouchella hunanensis]